MMWIEIFKTNVTNSQQANWLIEEIHRTFNYRVNFDLSDCDRILRVVSSTENIQSAYFIAWLKKYGCCAEVLPDN
jgi:hypothetical protein